MKPLHAIAGVALVSVAVLLFQRGAASPVNHAELVNALDTAKSEGKCVFLVFSGSDWCGWCIKLEDEVLSRREFKEYAEDHLVVVTADFPRCRSDQSEDLMKRNEQLARDFGVRGFPTVLILDPYGRKIAKTGYRQGGAEAYVNHIKKLTAHTE